jgi:hypothetical protein
MRPGGDVHRQLAEVPTLQLEQMMADLGLGPWSFTLCLADSEWVPPVPTVSHSLPPHC